MGDCLAVVRVGPRILGNLGQYFFPPYLRKVSPTHTALTGARPVSCHGATSTNKEKDPGKKIGDVMYYTIYLCIYLNLYSTHPRA